MRIFHALWVLSLVALCGTAQAAIKNAEMSFYIHIDPPAEAGAHEHDSTAYWYLEETLLEDGAIAPDDSDCDYDTIAERYAGWCNNSGDNIEIGSGQDKLAIADGTGFIDLSWLCIPWVGCADDTDIWITDVSYELVERQTDLTTDEFIQLRDTDESDATYGDLPDTEINEYAEMNHHSGFNAIWPSTGTHGGTPSFSYGDAPFGDNSTTIALIGSEQTDYSLPTSGDGYGINVRDAVLTMPEDSWHWTNPAEVDLTDETNDIRKEVFIKVTLSASYDNESWQDTNPPESEEEHEPYQPFGENPGTALTNVHTNLTFLTAQLVNMHESTNTYTFEDWGLNHAGDVIMGVPHVHDHGTEYTITVTPAAGGSAVIDITDSPNNDADWNTSHEVAELNMDTAHEIKQCMNGTYDADCFKDKDVASTSNIDTVLDWGDHSGTSHGHLPIGGLDVWAPAPASWESISSGNYDIVATVDWDNPHTKSSWIPTSEYIDNMYGWIFFIAE